MTKRFEQFVQTLPSAEQDAIAQETDRLIAKEGQRQLYRTILKAIMATQAEEMERQPVVGVDVELLIDEAHDNYMLVPVGWSPQGRVRGATLYVRLRNGKFWIEEDWTEEGIATHLLAAGVLKEDIVLAFHAPEVRPYTEFAVA